MNFIYKTYPRHTKDNVPLDEIIEVFFMIDMNSKSMKEEHFILFNITEENVEPITFDYTNRHLKIRPKNRLKPLSHYQLNIVGGEDGVKDITGRKMPQIYEVEFKTVDVESMKPPVILSPTQNTIAKEPIEIHLSPSERAIYYELQVSKSNVFHHVEWPKDGEIVYQTASLHIIPDIEYDNGNYYVRVRSSDAEGNKSAWSKVVQFYYSKDTLLEEIIKPEEPKFPTEKEDVIDSDSKEDNLLYGPLEEEITLVSNSRLHSDSTNQLEGLQNIFENSKEEEIVLLNVTRTSPKDNSVNNELEGINKIIVEFDKEIDQNTVDSDSCYILKERN